MKSLFIALLLVITPFFSLLNAQTVQKTELAQVKFKFDGIVNPGTYFIRFGVVRFTSDDKIIAIGSKNKGFLFYDTETGKKIGNFAGDGDGSNAFSFALDNKFALAQDINYLRVKVWNLADDKLSFNIAERDLTNSLRKTLETPKQRGEGLEMKDFQISPNGKNILVGIDDGTFKVVNLADGQTRFKIEQTSKPSETLAMMKILFVPFSFYIPNFYHSSEATYNSQGDRILLTNGNKIPTLWDAETGKMLAKLEPNSDGVFFGRFSSDGQLIATYSDGITKIWDSSSGKLIKEIGTKSNREIFISWHPILPILATASSASEIHLIDANTGNIATKAKSTPFRYLTFNPQGSLFATINKDGDDSKFLGQLFNSQTGELITSFPREKGETRILSLFWSPDGKFLVATSRTFVKIFNSKGELIQNLENAIFPARFSSNGNLLATYGKDNTAYLWEIKQN